MGGGADAGAGLGSFIGHEDHRMMTSTAAIFLFTGTGRLSQKIRRQWAAVCWQGANAVFTFPRMSKRHEGII
ncbi:hypothetical protein CO654_11655 [Rhizobium sp. L18]|nr:hypothetical protein CO654_11655 [Rhizobium sp. L18]